MNSWLAAIFVTCAWLSLAYSAFKREDAWVGSKIGLLFYATGTLVWSLKGLELSEAGLILISAVQTCAVLVGVILL